MAVPIMVLDLTILTLAVNAVRPCERGQSMLNRRLDRLSGMRVIVYLTFTVKVFNSVPQERMCTRLRSVASNNLASLAGRVPFSIPPQQNNGNVLHMAQ